MNRKTLVGIVLVSLTIYSCCSALKISLYYETLCPDSQRFVKQQLHQAYQLFGDQISVQLIPFGNVDEYKDTNGVLKYHCQHGIQECRVVAPKHLSPNTQYHVSVSVYRVSRPLQVDVRVMGSTDNSASGSVHFDKSDTKTVSLEIGDWSDGNYTLAVDIGSGITVPFKPLFGLTRASTLDRHRELLVQFRVIVVDQSLVPKVNTLVDIYIKDENRNRIKQWTQVLVTNVIGGGDIVLTHSLDIPGNSNSYEFSVMAVHRMAPKARILCYYVREDNEEVVADAMDFEVDGLFRTDVSIDTDLKEAEPGAQVAVRVNTKPDAWVGIVGVDQSVLLLKSGNDMTHKDVIQKLQTYDTTGINTFWSYNSSTAEQVFDNSGVVVVSNGFIYENEVYSVGPGESSQSVRSKSIVWRSLHHNVEEVRQRSVSQSAPLDRQSQSKPTQTNVGISVKTRKHFPETWLWTSMQTGSNGCAVIKSTIPDTITSWFISAFAMHMEAGLGIAPTPTKVTVFRPFFIKLSLPYSIIRGETVAIEAIVFNYTTKPIQSEVVFDNKKQEFEFSHRLHTKGVNVSEMRQLVSIPANDGVLVTFTITPKTMGYIDIKLTATSAMAGDSVLKKLLVKPEGQTQHFNQSVLVDLKESANILTKN
ncbi:unnamed protein product, partial [Oppiella nova]